MPPKVWRPKAVNKYIPPDYADDINEVIFYFSKCGKAVYIPRIHWEEGKRTNLINFDNSKHRDELHKNTIVSTKVTPDVR